MNTLLIGYDLNRPSQNYEDLFKVIKAEGTWCHNLDSTWLAVGVKSNETGGFYCFRWVGSCGCFGVAFGSLIQAVSGIFGGVGRRANRSGFAV